MKTKIIPRAAPPVLTPVPPPVPLSYAVAAPPKYDAAWSFSGGMAAVSLNGKYGYIDETGSEVIPCRYDAAGRFSEGLATVKLHGKWGYIDKTGGEVIPCQYDSAGTFHEGLAAVQLKGKWGYISVEKIKPIHYCARCAVPGQAIDN